MSPDISDTDFIAAVKAEFINEAVASPRLQGPEWCVGVGWCAFMADREWDVAYRGGEEDPWLVMLFTTLDADGCPVGIRGHTLAEARRKAELVEVKGA